MMTHEINPTVHETTATPTPARTNTPPAGARALLACGVLAGPLYVAVGLAQVVTRDGFDLRRHALSLLSNGDLGWIQIANFVVCGLLVVACAVGVRRTLREGRGRTWAPILLGGYGVGLLLAGAFRADPMDGFPVGTPAGPPVEISWHGALHFVVGAVSFVALIAACIVLARRFAAAGQRGWAAYSAATGIVFLAAFAGIASGGGNEALNLSFAVAVVLAWTWLSLTAARFRSGSAR